MDEEEFDSLIQGRPFETADVARSEAQARRGMTLGVALWGRTSADLQRQLLAPHPAIPLGFELDDFRALHRMAHTIATMLRDPRSGLSGVVRSGATVFRRYPKPRRVGSALRNSPLRD
jgi:hypothetical protein